MVKRAIDTPIREAILLPDGMAITLFGQSKPAALGTRDRSFVPMRTRCNQAGRSQQATILTFARDALTAQIEVIAKAHGPIPHELP